MTKFFIISLCVFAIFHIISYYCLIKPLFSHSSLKAKILGILALLINYALLFAFIFIRSWDIPDILFVILSITILISVMLCSAGLANIIFLVLSLWIKKFPIVLTSRILFALAIFGVCWGVYSASKLPQITAITIPINHLKKDIRILQIADLHLSQLISAKKVKEIINLANSTSPDIIVLVGDIIDSPEYKIASSLALLKELKAKYGVYFVLGNHEYIHNANKSLEIINNLGNIKPLVNSSIIIDNNINLIGVSDLHGIREGYLEPDIALATKHINPALPSILLSHQPNIIKHFSPKDTKIDLILSGHTHGGQIFPFSFIVYLANPFLYGLKTINDIPMYITQGTNLAVTYGRVGTNAEINLITLTGAKQ